MIDLAEGLGYSGAGVLLSVLITYVIALRKGAEDLDKGWQQTESVKDAEIERLRGEVSALQLNPTEHKHLEIAQAAMERYDLRTKTVLRHLRIHGSISEDTNIPAKGPDGMRRDDLLEVLDVLTRDCLVSRRSKTVGGGYENTWEIAPGMVSALDKILYERN